MHVGDCVVLDKPCVHQYWVIEELLVAIGTDRVVAAYVTALDAFTNRVPDYWAIVPISKLTIDNKRKL